MPVSGHDGDLVVAGGRPWVALKCPEHVKIGFKPARVAARMRCRQGVPRWL